jgi:hypothetical protein
MNRSARAARRNVQHFQHDHVVSLAQCCQRGSLSIDDLISQMSHVRHQTLGRSKRVTRQYWKDHGINSHHPNPVTDATRHAGIDRLSQVPRLGVVKERRIQDMSQQPRNLELNRKIERSSKYPSVMTSRALSASATRPLMQPCQRANRKEQDPHGAGHRE